MTTKARCVGKRRATYQDVLDAPPHKVAEVLDGCLLIRSRPAARHAWAISRLVRRLDRSFNPGGGGPGGWWIFRELELHLGGDIVVPHVVGWRHDTMTEFPNMAYCTIAPDWACEILSPSARRLDPRRKWDVYSREGVRHLWVIDPGNRTLETFELHEGHWALRASLAESESVSSPPFEAISFSLDLLWPDAIAEKFSMNDEA